ncbi:hypothetical protein VNI00_009181 [Paramarasmius palmivorus]|uniref:Uncharacterized protein n=1 Tax=Paramarasmius palmivorus TaxID=297713 RepID=A0AAW0CNU6_9AGAR
MRSFVTFVILLFCIAGIVNSTPVPARKGAPKRPPSQPRPPPKPSSKRPTSPQRSTAIKPTTTKAIVKPTTTSKPPASTFKTSSKVETITKGSSSVKATLSSTSSSGLSSSPTAVPTSVLSSLSNVGQSSITITPSSAIIPSSLSAVSSSFSDGPSSVASAESTNPTVTVTTDTGGPTINLPPIDLPPITIPTDGQEIPPTDPETDGAPACPAPDAQVSDVPQRRSILDKFKRVFRRDESEFVGYLGTNGAVAQVLMNSNQIASVDTLNGAGSDIGPGFYITDDLTFAQALADTAATNGADAAIQNSCTPVSGEDTPFVCKVEANSQSTWRDTVSKALVPAEQIGDLAQQDESITRAGLDSSNAVRFSAASSGNQMMIPDSQLGQFSIKECVPASDAGTLGTLSFPDFDYQNIGVAEWNVVDVSTSGVDTKDGETKGEGVDDGAEPVTKRRALY